MKLGRFQRDLHLKVSGFSVLSLSLIFLPEKENSIFSNVLTCSVILVKDLMAQEIIAGLFTL